MSKKLFKNLMKKKHIEFMHWASRTHYYIKVKDMTLKDSSGKPIMGK